MISPAGAVLCRAFFVDPVFQWVLPNDDDRRALTGWFSAMVRWAEKFGRVDHLGDAAAPTAVALWGSKPADIVEHVRAGLVWPTVSLGPRALLRFMRIGGLLQDKHDLLCPEPHRYLYFLGVDPPYQRKGLGSELLEPALADADRDGLPCYLETATESNVNFYGRLGFECAWEGDLIRGAPRMWLLKRAPRSK